MANTFTTTDQVARAALATLYKRLTFAQLVHRDYDPEFVAGVGDTVRVRLPAVFTADEFDRSAGITVQDATEGSTPVKLDTVLDVSFDMPSEQRLLEVENFTNQLLVPAMEAIAQGIDQRLARLARDVPYVHGTAGTTPSDVPAITQTRRLLELNNVPSGMRSLVMDSDAEAKFLELNTFHNANESGDAGTAQREASLGRKFGFDTYGSNNVYKHTNGSLAATGTPAVSGTVAAGASSFTIGSTTLTGTLTRGSLFQVTVGGVTYTFATAADAAAAANAITVTTTTPAPVEIPDTTEVTIINDSVRNVAFHRDAFVLTSRTLPLPEGGATGSIQNYKGLGLRVTRGYDMSKKKDIISIDMLCGFTTISPERAAIMLG